MKKEQYAILLVSVLLVASIISSDGLFTGFISAGDACSVDISSCDSEIKQYFKNSNVLQGVVSTDFVDGKQTNSCLINPALNIENQNFYWSMEQPYCGKVSFAVKRGKTVAPRLPTQPVVAQTPTQIQTQVVQTPAPDQPLPVQTQTPSQQVQTVSPSILKEIVYSSDYQGNNRLNPENLFLKTPVNLLLFLKQQLKQTDKLTWTLNTPDGRTFSGTVSPSFSTAPVGKPIIAASLGFSISGVYKYVFYLNGAELGRTKANFLIQNPWTKEKCTAEGQKYANTLFSQEGNVQAAVTRMISNPKYEDAVIKRLKDSVSTYLRQNCNEVESAVDSSLAPILSTISSAKKAIGTPQTPAQPPTTVQTQQTILLVNSFCNKLTPFVRATYSNYGVYFDENSFIKECSSESSSLTANDINIILSDFNNFLPYIIDSIKTKLEK